VINTYGKLPRGERKIKIQNSNNYNKGSFENILETPPMAEGVSMTGVIRDFLFSDNNKVPKNEIPIVKTNIKNISASSPSIIWFGHSSYMILIDNKKILVDPVFSGNASPLSLFAKEFKGTEFYKPQSIGEIDFLILTHDHYDHLDYKTIKEIKSRTKHIVTSLGVGEHLEFWGVDKKIITELNWGENISFDGFNIHCRPARHFSGRLIKRYQTLWSSFILEYQGLKIFIGGDSGFDEETFAYIGKEFPEINLALLECGQYNQKWPYIHMKPEETAMAGKLIGAKKLFPVHWAKFSLAMHPWNEPIKRLQTAAEEKELNLFTPKIGEVVNFLAENTFEEWWNFE
jgi:L-ascorbate metabolism protein UlaG (beta-lactamase superfamily)